MYRLGPLSLDQSPPAGLDGADLVEWLLTVPMTNDWGSPIGLAAGLSGDGPGSYDSEFAQAPGADGATLPTDGESAGNTLDVASPDGMSEIDTSADARVGSFHGLFASVSNASFGGSANSASASWGVYGLDALPDTAAAGAGAPRTDDGLIFLDFESFAKGGNGGSGGGGGGGKPGGGDTGGDPNVISSYVSGDPGGYNVEVSFSGIWTSNLQQAFIDAADWISSIIVGDVADVFFRGKIIDDIKISAELTEIDGVGGILGQAGPTAVRTASYLPATAIMQFDSADADTFNGMGLWDEIVQHEMLHSIGFGSIWSYLGLISGSGTDTPTFTGAAATLTYAHDSGNFDANGVPIENDGGAGTKESHWDEELFGAELMTGWLDSSGVYISNMTVASLEDLGYDTTWTPDSFAIA